MEAPVDLATTAAVRRVMVRYWIDLGHLSVRATRGLVCISGQLIALPEAHQPLDPFVISELFAEIQHIPSVKRLNISLANWVEVDERWQPVAAAPSAGSVGHSAPSGTA